jgi:hypothetical protein
MARYTPGNVADPQMAAELAKIAQAMETPDQFLMLDTLYAEPTKFREGTIVKADGTTWDPGSGAGYYGYRGGAWRFLG